MQSRLHTYTAYGFGCAVVWALILAFVSRARRGDLEKYRHACMMWWAGWTSATIARSVYSPPKRHRPRNYAPGS